MKIEELEENKFYERQEDSDCKGCILRLEDKRRARFKIYFTPKTCWKRQDNYCCPTQPLTNNNKIRKYRELEDSELVSVLL
jgi:hypothetical protein